jgi:hypothetical protein
MGFRNQNEIRGGEWGSISSGIVVIKTAGKIFFFSSLESGEKRGGEWRALTLEVGDGGGAGGEGDDEASAEGRLHEDRRSVGVGAEGREGGWWCGFLLRAAAQTGSGGGGENPTRTTLRAPAVVKDNSLSIA